MEKIKMPIIGVTKEKNGKDYEKIIISYLREKLSEINSRFDLIDYSKYDDDKIENSLTDVFDEKKVILLTDASFELTSEYKNVCELLYNMEIDPFIFVIHIEDPVEELKEVGNRASVLTEYFDSTTSWISNLYKQYYFNLDTEEFFSGPNCKTPKTIYDFENALREYCRECNLKEYDE